MKRIQNEQWLNALPEEAVNVAEEINIEIAKVIAERIKAIGELTPSDVKKLTNSLQFLGADLKKITKIISEYSERGQRATTNALKQAADASDEFAEVLYAARKKSARSWQNDLYLHKLVDAMAKQTGAQFSNLSQTLAYKINNQTISLRRMYTRAIDKAIYEVQSGTVDYHTAMRKTVKELSSNMRYVHWESGHTRRLDSHVRQNLIDGVKQLQTQMLDYHGDQFASDGVELSAHAICAPDHLAVQGRQFSNDEFDKMQNGLDFEDVNGNEYKGFPRPIGQWNCRHVKFPIIIGVSKPAHTDEELKAYAENSREKYKLTQQQRAMETRLRQLKTERLVASAAGDELEAKRIQKKINEQQAEYRQFSAKNNLLYDARRASVEGYRRIAVKVAPMSKKGIQWNAKSDNISLEQYKDLRDYAQSRGIVLRGFKNSDVDLTLAKEFIDDAAKILKDFPEIISNVKKPFTFQLDYFMNNDDFAEVAEGSTHIIKFNGNALRDKLKLAEEYSKLSESGFFVKGTDYHSIIHHEMGHIIGDIRKTNSLALLKEILQTPSTTETLNWCAENLSHYSSKYLDGSEIISEAFSAFCSNRANETILTFLKKCNII